MASQNIFDTNPMIAQQAETTSGSHAEMLQRMLDAGVHVGHSKSKGHPKMKQYVFMNRQNIQIINVEKTLEKLKEASVFLSNVIARGGVVLFVATKMPAKLPVKEMAEALHMPWVSERWLGGTLTNFSILSKRLEYFIAQELKKSKGEFEKYSKKEQTVFAEELAALERKMGGMKTLKKIPDALFIVDIAEHISAVREARRVGVPVVAISDTNTDPSLVSYPIPANDKSMPSLRFITEYLTPILQESKKKQAVSAPPDGKDTPPAAAQV